MIDAPTLGRQLSGLLIKKQIRLILQPRPSAEAGFNQNEIYAASCPVPDKANALWLQPRRAQSGHQIDQPLRLVNQKKTSAPPQRPRRSRAERVKRAADFASRGAEAVLRMQISASRRVVGRIGQHAVKASGRDFRVRLPQIAADDTRSQDQAPGCRAVSGRNLPAPWNPCSRGTVRLKFSSECGQREALPYGLQSKRQGGCCVQHPPTVYVLIPQRSRRWGILQRRYRSPRTDQRR